MQKASLDMMINKDINFDEVNRQRGRYKALEELCNYIEKIYEEVEHVRTTSR